MSDFTGQQHPAVLPFGAALSTGTLVPSDPPRNLRDDGNLWTIGSLVSPNGKTLGAAWSSTVPALHLEAPGGGTYGVYGDGTLGSSSFFYTRDKSGKKTRVHAKDNLGVVATKLSQHRHKQLVAKLGAYWATGDKPAVMGLVPAIMTADEYAQRTQTLAAKTAKDARALAKSTGGLDEEEAAQDAEDAEAAATQVVLSLDDVTRVLKLLDVTDSTAKAYNDEPDSPRGEYGVKKPSMKERSFNWFGPKQADDESIMSSLKAQEEIEAQEFVDDEDAADERALAGVEEGALGDVAEGEEFPEEEEEDDDSILESVDADAD